MPEDRPMKVRDVMTHGVIAVKPTAPLKEAVRLMERHAISGLPVVDDFGTVVGVLSEADLLLKEVGQGGVTRRRFGWLLGDTRRDRVLQSKTDAVTVAEAMHHPVVFVNPDESVRAAARRMVERRVNRLPVVADGKLVGILTRADVARTFLRPDEEIEQTVRAEISRCTVGSKTGTFDVGVVEGVVRVTGWVERRSTAEVLESVIAQVDGVVATEMSINWSLDDSQATLPEPDYLDLLWPRGR